MKRFCLATVAAAGVLLWTAEGVLAQEVKLRFATISNAASTVPAKMLHPWAQEINERGRGTLQLDVRDGLAIANFNNHYTRVLDDVVQVAWGMQAFVSGKFALSEVSGLPFMFETGAVGSRALWQLYKTGLIDADYDQIVPFMLTTVTPTNLHFAKPVKSLDELQGLKIQTVNRVYSQAAQVLGGAPISLPLNDMYEAFQRGTIDGAAIGWTAFPGFRLAEVTSYHVETSFGTSAGMVYMAKKKFDGLPAATRKVLTDTDPEAWSMRFGDYWDGQAAFVRKQIAETGKHTVVSLSPAQEASWRKKLEPIVEDWAESHPNGKTIVQSFRKLVADVKAGK